MSGSASQNRIFANQRKAFARIRDSEENLDSLSRIIDNTNKEHAKIAARLDARIKYLEFRETLFSFGFAVIPVFIIGFAML